MVLRSSVNDMPYESTIREAEMNRGRGKLLTTLLILAGLSYVIDVYVHTTSAEIQPLLSVNRPEWVSTFISIRYMMDLISMVGIWMLRKWAVYLFIAFDIIGLVIGTSLPSPTPMILGAMFQWMVLLVMGLITLLWCWAISRKWQSFT